MARAVSGKRSAAPGRFPRRPWLRAARATSRWGPPSPSPTRAGGRTKLSVGGGGRPAELPRGSAFVRRDPGRTPEATRASTASGVGGAVAGLRWPPSLSLAALAFIAGRRLSFLSTHMAQNASTVTLQFSQLRLEMRSQGSRPRFTRRRRNVLAAAPPPAPSLCGT